MQSTQRQKRPLELEAETVCPPLSQSAIYVVGRQVANHVDIDVRLLTNLEAPKHGKTTGAMIVEHDLDNHLLLGKPMTSQAAQEFIAGALFQRALLKFSPQINLTSEHQMTSRFLEARRSKTLGDYSANERTRIIKEYFGLEKIIAATMRFADLDLNLDNLIPIDDKGQKRLYKIDHGWALTAFFTLEESMRRFFMGRFKIFLPFINLQVLCNEIDNVCAISDEEIDKLVQIRIHRLKKHKHNKPLKFLIGIDKEVKDNNPKTTYEWMYFKDCDDYAQFILEMLKEQKRVMLKMKKYLELCIKIEARLLSPENHRMHILTSHDPIMWAHKHQKPSVSYNDLSAPLLFRNRDTRLTLDGKSPVRYALDNNILGYDTRHHIVLHRNNFTGSDFAKAISFAPNDKEAALLCRVLIPSKIKIGEESVLDYMIRCSLISGFNIIMCIQYELKLNDKHPIAYACDNNIAIDGLHPLVFAMRNKIKVNGEMALAYWDPRKPEHKHPSIHLEFLISDVGAFFLKPNQKEVLYKFALLHNIPICKMEPQAFCRKFEIKFGDQKACRWLEEKRKELKAKKHLDRVLSSSTTTTTPGITSDL